MYIVCFFMCSLFFCFIFISGSLRPELFLLCDRNSPRKHFGFQKQMKCQLQQLKCVEICSASVFSTQLFFMKNICFSKEIHWMTHFHFFGSKIKETKVVDANPPGHLICNCWRFTKQTRDGQITT